MNNLNSKTLAQIVSLNHRTATVFEKYNLDFCCKGKRSLEQACDEISVPVEQLMQELEATLESPEKPVDFNSMTLSQLADYIVVTHHDYVKREMPQIYFYLQKLASKHGGRHPELHKILERFTVLKDEMTMHMQKEEAVLFPRIKRMESAEKMDLKTDPSFIQSPVDIMEQEHDHAGSVMQEIRELTSNYVAPSDGCTTYKLCFAALQAFETDLHHHVHLENNILFPKSIELAVGIARLN